MQDKLNDVRVGILVIIMLQGLSTAALLYVLG